MTTERYRVLAAIAVLSSALALVSPGLLASRPALPRGAVPSAATTIEAQKAAPGETRPLPSPEKVAAFFGWVPPPLHSEALPLPKEAKKADWIRPLGEIENEDGVGYLFFKDEGSGRVFKVRRDGGLSDSARLVSESPESFILRVENDTYIVPRRR